jgi:hypothetical protein
MNVKINVQPVNTYYGRCLTTEKIFLTNELGELPSLAGANSARKGSTWSQAVAEG